MRTFFGRQLLLLDISQCPGYAPASSLFSERSCSSLLDVSTFSQMRACKPSPYVYVELFQKSGQMLSWVRPGWGGAGVLTFSDIDIVVFVIVGEDADVLTFSDLEAFSSTHSAIAHTCSRKYAEGFSLLRGGGREGGVWGTQKRGGWRKKVFRSESSFVSVSMFLCVCYKREKDPWGMEVSEEF